MINININTVKLKFYCKLRKVNCIFLLVFPVCTDSTGRERFSSGPSEVNGETDEYTETENDEADADEYDENERRDNYWDSQYQNPNQNYFTNKDITDCYFPTSSINTKKTTNLSSTFTVKKKKTQSMLNLGTPSTAQKSSTLSPYGDGAAASSRTIDERARSMEFLLNDSNKNSHLLVSQLTS